MQPLCVYYLLWMIKKPIMEHAVQLSGYLSDICCSFWMCRHVERLQGLWVRARGRVKMNQKEAHANNHSETRQRAATNAANEQQDWLEASRNITGDVVQSKTVFSASAKYCQNPSWCDGICGHLGSCFQLQDEGLSLSQKSLPWLSIHLNLYTHKKANSTTTFYWFNTDKLLRSIARFFFVARKISIQFLTAKS